MKIDPKVKNLIIFVVKWLGGLTLFLTAYVKWTKESNPFVLAGHFTIFILIWRALLFLTRKYLLRTPTLSSRGKWCILVDDGSTVSDEFADHLAAKNMPLYILSTTTESRASELVSKLSTKNNMKIELKYHKFGDVRGDASFYEDFTKTCQKLDSDGGIGLLVCNFGIADLTSTLHEEISVAAVDSVLGETVYPFVHVLSIVHALMVKRRSGAVLTVSSALGSHSAPYFALYSATKAFMTQLTRSLHIESWGTGVVFLAVTPFDSLAALSRSDASGVVHTALRQLGKQYFWQICGSYASIALDWAVGYNPFAFGIMRRHLKATFEGRVRAGAFSTHTALVTTTLAVPVAAFSLALYLCETGFLSPRHISDLGKLFLVVGLTACLIGFWRVSLSTNRRLLSRPRSVSSYGKWAIVTGSTSGIGKDYAAYLAKKGQSVLIISRSESKLIEQKKELLSTYPNISVEYLAFDFSQPRGTARDAFYERLELVGKQLHADGGVGLLVNNVGTANEYPKRLEEFASAEIDDMLNCNISSTLLMTRCILKLMKARGKGAIINVSSGSGNHCGPLLALYSSTKIFMTQFSRSLHAECWGSGVESQVLTPFYIVSNLFKRRSGTIIAPMPIALIKGSLAQLGKKYVWQSHGYWFHGFIGAVSHILWITVARYRKMMFDNRARYDERTKKE